MMQFYLKKATELFYQLFPFKENTKLIDNKRMQIIPDRKLHNIPFEALTTSNKDNLIDSYLLKKAEIYYQYTFSLSIHHMNLKNYQHQSFVGFLPIEFNAKSLPTLTKEFTEINSTVSNFNNEIYTYNQATKNNF